MESYNSRNANVYAFVAWTFVINVNLLRYVNKEKEIPSKNGKQFIRKGQVGDWQNHFTPEMNQQWDPWIAKQLQGSEDFPMVFTSQQN